MNTVANSSHRGASTNGLMVAVLASVILIAVLTGLAVGMGAYLLAVPLIILLPAAFLLRRPDICLSAMAGLTLLIAGILKYFLGLGQFQWVVSALGVTLLTIALTGILFSRGRNTSSLTSIEIVLALWWIVLTFASLVNLVPVLDWFVGIRIYLPFLGVFAYIAYCNPSERLLRNLLMFLLLVASVQWAFCVYQKFIIVPQRISGGYFGSPWDSVVGTFGGDKFGGGESGSLGVFLVVALVIAASLNKAKQLIGFSFWFVVLFGLAAVALIESKVIVLLLPLGVLIVYSDQIMKHPGRFLLLLLSIPAFVLAVLSAYHYMYWQSETRLDLLDSILQRMSYSFDPNFRVTSISLGRVGSLAFWWNNHSVLENPLTFLVGHGLASAVGESSVIGMGAAVRNFGYLLDTTGATKLLWESGILGLVLFLSIFVSGFLSAGTLSKSIAVPEWHRAAMVGVQATMLIMLLAVFYEVTTVSSPPMQFVNMLLLGYIVYWKRSILGGVR